MNLPANKTPSKPATPWELAMSQATGIPVEGLRVGPSNPFILSKEQRAMMAELATPGTHAHKMFTETSK